MRDLARLFPSLCAAALGLGLAGPAAAGRLVEVSIANRDTGERLTPIRHAGRLYVVGAPGQRYAVELTNRLGERVLAVVSVDGVNVLSGQTAAPTQSGYVLDAGRRYAINGWRKSLDEVAQFVFTALPDSYAARTGRPQHVGVIGVAAFREKPAPVVLAPPPEAVSSAPASSAKSAGAGAAADAASGGALREERAPAAAPRLGTGHGEREHSPTRLTDFERAGETPDEVLTIYYDSRANLVARGILRPPRVADPQPFPGALPGFVPDPRG